MNCFQVDDDQPMTLAGKAASAAWALRYLCKVHSMPTRIGVRPLCNAQRQFSNLKRDAMLFDRIATPESKVVSQLPTYMPERVLRWSSKTGAVAMEPRS